MLSDIGPLESGMILQTNSNNLARQLALIWTLTRAGDSTEYKTFTKLIPSARPNRRAKPCRELHFLSERTLVSDNNWVIA